MGSLNFMDGKFIDHFEIRSETYIYKNFIELEMLELTRCVQNGWLVG